MPGGEVAERGFVAAQGTQYRNTPPVVGLDRDEASEEDRVIDSVSGSLGGKCLRRGSIQGPLESESDVITTKLLEGLPAMGFTSLPPRPLRVAPWALPPASVDPD